MNWLKQNVVILACSVVFASLVGLTGWQIHKANVRKQEVDSELQAKQGQIQQLRNGNPYPAKENIDALRNDRTRLQELYQAILTDINGSKIEAPTLKRDVDFGLFLVKSQTALRQSAASNTNLEDFAFGFSRYKETFPCRSASVRGADCEQLLTILAKQMVVVDKITRLLIESGTGDILEILRAQVEPGPPGADTLPWTATTDPKALYTTMPFQFKFACAKTEVIQSFLNKLADADCFFEVRNLIIDTEAYAVSLANPTGEAPPVNPGRPSATATMAETKHRLIVTARIDLVEFVGSTNAPPGSANSSTAVTSK